MHIRHLWCKFFGRSWADRVNLLFAVLMTGEKSALLTVGGKNIETNSFSTFGANRKLKSLRIKLAFKLNKTPECYI